MDRIQESAEQVVEIEDMIRLDCSIVLEGALHPDLKIGNLLPKA